MSRSSYSFNRAGGRNAAMPFRNTGLSSPLICPIDSGPAGPLRKRLGGAAWTSGTVTRP